MYANALTNGSDPGASDLTALAWLRDELNKSIEAAALALERACAAQAGASAEPDLPALQAARGHLHQALGALEMAGLSAPAQVLRAMESAAQSFIERPSQCTPEAVAKVAQAGRALAAYLEGLLCGRALSPVALFPQYRAAQALSGPDSAHPADLWPFDWTWQPLPTTWGASPLAAAPTVRARFDAAVLRLVKSGDDESARELADLCAGLAVSAQVSQVASFWAIATAFFEARALRLLADDLYVKRAVAGVLVQYTRLAKSQAQVSQRMARDLLFFCAQSCPDNADAAPRLTAVRKAWGLAHQGRLDYEEVQFGQFDPARLAQARKFLATVRDGWAALAGGDVSRSRATAEQLSLLCEALAHLHSTLMPLTHALQAVGVDLARLAVTPQAELAMETATTILFLDAVLVGSQPADGQLAVRTRQLAERLDRARQGTGCGPVEPWMEDLYRASSDRQTLGSVVGELRIALADLEKELDGFVRQPQSRDVLRNVPARLTQLRGVLSVLGLNPAVQATARMRDTVQAFLLSGEELTPADLQVLGNNLGALGFLIDMLAYQPALVPGLFVFDEAQGELRPVMGRTQAAPLARPGAWSAAPVSAQTPVPATDAGAAADAAPAALVVPSPSPEQAPELAATARVDDDDGAELRAIFLDEAREVIGAGRRALETLVAEPADPEAMAAARRAFHTLKGSARMVGLSDFGEAGWILEEVLNDWLASQKPASDALRQMVRQALDLLAQWLEDIASGSQPRGSVAAFAALVDGIGLSAQDPTPCLPPKVGGQPDSEPVPSPPSGPTAEQVADPIAEPDDRLLAPDPGSAATEADPLVAASLLEIFLAEADDWSLRLQEGVCAWAQDPSQPVPAAVVGLAHALAGSSSTVGLHSLADLARRLESSMRQTQAASRATAQHARAYAEAAEDIRSLLHQVAAGFLDESASQVGQGLNALDPFPISSVLPGAAAPVRALAADPGEFAGDMPSRDAVDVDLLPFFLEEAHELVPSLGGALRKWQVQPQGGGAREQVLRALHTLKGSARLAGALRVGGLSHALESAIEALPDDACADDLEPLLPAFDELRAAIDGLRPGVWVDQGGSPAPQGPAAHDSASALLSPPNAGTGEPDLAVCSAAPAVPTAGPLAPPRPAATAVRVRSDLLDRLMDRTGQVMVTRSRLEAELQQLRASLGDLTGNLERLRGQLRDIELQAESQMQSRMAQAKGSAAGFDPLELDRFTRVQELTRMMAESVNDVATVQRTLQRTVESSEDDLAAQARQTRELQRDLLHTRMVGFESVAERLHGVVRLAARETGKQARLDMQGEAIEMDRSVLERMAPVFEHLLRNAVAHGIEDPADRIAAGKAPVGRILITLSHEGNDVALAFEDDGAGLDLARIRGRALALGLLKDAEVLDESQAADLVFTPGFSTATQLTELAGRGIGMDVVRAEVHAMGGRIDLASRPGQGMRLRLVLPLTTAVTQVVMLRCGRCVFGVPAPLVESVNRASAKDVQQAYNAGLFVHAGESLPFFWGGALLQASPRSTEPQGRAMAVVIVRSAAQRLALHIDEVIGHDEVVVKNLGPQLARLPGLAGMTVLASGAPVLIYNPVALAAVHGGQARAFGGDQAQPHMLAMARSQASPHRPLVLVVDDSITVRRVTQRLLQREGYRVAVACDGLQALEQLAQAGPDRPVVVLSDIEMPRMDGFELTRNLRADPRWADLPIVMITSRSAAKHREHAVALGVDHYLGKPYPDEELLALVRRYAAAFLTTA